MQSPLLKKIRIASSNIVFRLVFLVLLLMVVFNFTPGRFIFVKAYNNQIKIFPGEYAIEENDTKNFVWENVNNVFLQYLAPDSELSEFNQDNSAFIALQKTSKKQFEDNVLPEFENFEELPDIEVMTGNDDVDDNNEVGDDELSDIIIDDSIEENKETDDKNKTLEPDSASGGEDANLDQVDNSQPVNQENNQKETENKTENQADDFEDDILIEDNPELSGAYEKIKFLFSKFSNFSLFTIFNKNLANAEEKAIQQSVIFSDFSVPFEYKEQEINSLNLYLSLAARSAQENDNLSFAYSLGETWEKIIVLELNQEYSNSINNGYFNFQLPKAINWEEIENLKIKISYNNPKLLPEIDGQDLDFFIFLDSFWLEVEYDNVDKEEENKDDYIPEYEEDFFEKQTEDSDSDEYSVDLLNTKTNFKITENPELNFRYKKNKNLVNKIISGLVSPFTDEYSHIKISADLRDAMGNKTGLKPEIRYVSEGEFLVKIPENIREFRPGKYFFEIEIENKGEIYQTSQDFSWGVLAINVNKAVYRPGEKAYLQMGVLDDFGHTLCNANLFLEITAPNGKINIFSTDDNTILKNPKCAGDTVISEPDYYSYYSVLNTGVYQIELRAETENGIREIYDEFKVEFFSAFELERIGPTRIFPLADYEMKMILRANESFQGSAVEYVPENFKIKDSELLIKNLNSEDVFKISSSSLRESVANGRKELIWEGLDVKQNDVIEIKYLFDAPNISPEFYLLGSLKLADKHYFSSDGKEGQLVFEEERLWQIASDAVTIYDADSGYMVCDSPDDFSFPERAWDSSTTTYAYYDYEEKSNDGLANYLQASSTGISDLGSGYSISKVEIGMKGYSEDGDINANLIPYFNGTDAGDTYEIPKATIGSSDSGTTSYREITSDDAGPGETTWNWSDLQNLEIRIWGDNDHSGRNRIFYVDQIRIRVEYSEPNDPPLGVFNSAVSKIDGSGTVDISIDVDDPDDDDVKAILQYVSGTDCDFTTPLDPTLDENATNISESYGTVNIENDNFYQIGNASGWIETDPATNTIQFDWDSLTDLPSGNDTYCLRLYVNDDDAASSTVATTTLIIDNVAPTAPGNLSVFATSGTSVILTFGEASTETNFSEYIIYYKEYDGASPIESDDSWASTSDSNLDSQTYDTATSTEITGLFPATQYVFNIWVYDEYGHIASATNEVVATTSDQLVPPVTTINSVAQKTDGTGVVDISLEVDDGNDDDVRVRVDYVVGAGCDFSSSLDPVLDETPANISVDSGTLIIDNSSVYQVGTTTGNWIDTGSGANTVQFDWLSTSHDPDLDGDYCVQFTANDVDSGDQITPVNTTITIDNTAPSEPGAMFAPTSTSATITLSFGADSGDTHFKEYKIYYKGDYSGVTESDNVYDISDDANLDEADFNSVATTTISGLLPETTYYFVIYAYDDYGNKASSTEISGTTTEAENIRARTVKFLAGTYSGNGGAGQNSDTNQTFSGFNFRLAESGVEIKNAYIIFEAQYESYANNAGNYTGYNLAFDACQESCAADAFSGTGRVLKDDNTVLSYDETESNQVRLLLDVTDEAQLAAYSGNNVNMEAQIGYRIERSASVNSISYANAILVITYTYNHNDSDSFTNTVFYPLESTASGDSGTKRSLQANCTRDSNCPTFDYQVDIPEIGTQLDYWFEVNLLNYDNNQTRTDDTSVDVNIEGVDFNSYTFYHENANAGGQGNMPGIYFGQFSNFGFSENTAQSLEVYANSTNYDYYLMGGEVVETYTASTSAATKTRTVSFPFGIVNNGSTIAQSTSSVSVYFPENGNSTGVVTIKKAWIRILSNNYSLADVNLTVSTKTGDNIQSGNWVYNYFPGQVNIKSVFKVTHIIPSADYSELSDANSNTKKDVIIYTTNSSTNQGGLSAELMITYAYTDEANGYLSSLDLFAGQTDVNGNTQSATATTANLVFSEQVGVQTIRAAAMRPSMLFSNSSGAMSSGNFTMDTDISSTTPSCSNVYISGSDGVNSYAEFYKDVKFRLSAINNSSYTACYSNNGGGSGTAGGKMNSALIYTYQYDVQPAVLTQNDWRWYDNTDAVQPVSAKAAENISISNINLADILRLRINIGATKEDLATSSKAFKLQYGEGNDCTAISGWEDVGGVTATTLWRGYDNSSVADEETGGSALLLSSNVFESYEEENLSVVNPTNIPQNNAGEWDWALYNYSATSSSDYCFRMVNSDDSLLDFYNSDSYAKLTTAATNTRPNAVSSLEQFKNIGTTTIPNTDWINTDSVRLRASVTDVNINENLALYFQLIQNINSFTTATAEPSNPCLNGTAYGDCGTNIWVATSTTGDYRTNSFTATATIITIPDLSSGYKWQVLACDDTNECSDWQQFDTGLNFRVDTTAPTAPGNLTLASTTANSLYINFGASTTEDNFKEYKIFYKEGSSGVTEANNEHNDPDLDFKNYSLTSDTLVESLSAGTQYVFNIWAYDFAGNSASATIEVATTTTSSFTPPTGSIFSLEQKIDGTGGIDIAIQADDGDNDNTLRAKVFYEAGSDCTFASPLDMTIDTVDENVSATYGDPGVDNDQEFQVGTTSAWIWTAPGSNFVFFDWLSKTEIPDANGTYCIGLIVSDGLSTTSPTSTMQILIDNFAPSEPGALTLNNKNRNSIKVNFAGQSSDSRFDRYRVFYSTSTPVTVNDYQHNDANLLLQDYGDAGSTTISNLEEGETYYINIWAYDDLGNRASSTEELTITTNSKPLIPSNLIQYKQNEITLIENGAWTNESEVRLLASSTDPDTSEIITLYFELLPSVGTFKTATTEPSEACVYGTAYNDCDSKVWFVASSSPGDFSVDPYVGTSSLTAIPDSDTGYKWQVLACDDDGDCANDWAVFNAGTPNFKIDTVNPTNPGVLSEYGKTSGSITLGFGATTTEENFIEYIIYYDTSSPVDESGTVHGSTTDKNLDNIDFDSFETTLIENLLPSTQYHFIIYAYDEVGRKASSTEISITTNAVASTPGAMFYTKNDRTLYYRVWTGSVWNAEQSGPTLGSTAGDNIIHIRAKRSGDGARIAILAKTWDGTNQEWWGTVYRVAADDFVNSGILGASYASANNNQLITGCVGVLSSGEFIIIRNNNGSAGTLAFSWDASSGWTSEGSGPGSTVGEVGVMNGCQLARRTNTDNLLLVTFDDTNHGGNTYGDVGTSYYYGGSTYDNSSWTTWTEHSSEEEDIDNYVGEAFFDPSDNTRGAINYSNNNNTSDTKVKKFTTSQSSPYISYGAEATTPATWSGDFIHGEFSADPNGTGEAWFAGDDINGELNVYKVDISASTPVWTASTNGDNISGTGLYVYTNESQKPYAIQFYKDGYGTVAWNEAISATPKYRVITASTNTVDAADTAVPGAEANIYSRTRSYKDPNENEFVAIYQNDDIDYSAVFWDGTNNVFYSSGNQAWTDLVTASGAADADYEATAFAFSAGNATPNTPTGLIQYKSDSSTTIANGTWTDENTVKLVASAKDADTSEVLSIYLQLIVNNGTFSSTTTHPINSCAADISFVACNSKTWLVASSSGDYSADPFVATATITLISDSDAGYKWQVMTCDDDSACSGWAKYNLSQPNFKVDIIDPTAPGQLIPISKTSTSVNLNFGATTTEDNFLEYKIFYSDSMPITELSSEYDDPVLDNILYGASGVSITSLTPDTLYHFNIYAYDWAGNVASSTVVSTTTNTTYNLVQTSYLLENDDGVDVNSNTSETNPDTALNNINIGERMNVRIQLENNGGDTASGKVYSLRYENQTDDADNWVNVGADTEISYSPGLSGDNGHPISSEKAANNLNTPKDGTWHEDTYQTGSFSLINNYYTEFVFAIETGNASTSKTYRLSLYNETDNKVLDGYNSTSTFYTVATETKRYSKEELDSLLTTTADLEYYFDGEGYDDVLADDNTNYDELGTTTANYAVINFATKHTNNTNAITVTWNGQSSASPVYATVYLQVYQYGSTNAWVTVDSDNTAATSTDFTLSKNLNSSLTEYYGASNWTYWRVYQDAGDQNLKSDYFNADFTAPVPEVAQIHYRWRNDDGLETTGDWLEAEDTGSPTASSSVEIGDNVRLRMETANTGGGDAINYNYRLEYATTTGNCSTDPGGWLTVPADSSEHWQMATSSYFTDGDPTTSQFDNTESYGFIAGDMVASSSNSSGNITLSEGEYTEIEYVIKTTVNAQSAGTYCFRATNAGTSLNVYSIFPVITLFGVSNTSPSFTPTGEPIDNDSASTSPKHYGSPIIFDATADDDEDDDYYLAICKTDSISAGNDAPPVCNGGDWCISELASSTDPATCSYIAATSTESLEWYGFVCDRHPGFAVGKCSASSQGNDTAANNSPFVINHPPVFTSISTTDDNKNPGGVFTITAIAYDSDVIGGADTLQLYVCYTDDASSGGCTGGGIDTVCSAASSSPNIECAYTDTAPSTSSDVVYYAFVFDKHGLDDGHNLAADNNSLSNTYTINNVASQIGNLILNNGVDIQLNIKPSTTTVQTISTSIEDQNGCSTIQSAVGRVYMSNVVGGYNCTADDNDCYHATITDCVKNCTDDTTAEITCSVGMEYFAIPTDKSTNNPNESYNWLSYMQVYDGANYSFATSTGVEVRTNLAFEVLEDEIDFGTGLFGDDNTGSDNSTTTIANCGNSPMYTGVQGTDLTGSGGTLLVGNIKWSLDNFTYADGTQRLRTTEEPAYLTAPRATSTAGVEDLILWGIEIPFGTSAEIYNGQNTFTVRQDSEAW